MPGHVFLIYALAAVLGTGSVVTHNRGSALAGCDSVPAGSSTVSAQHLTDFTVVRRLTLTRGDSVSPFGTQTETLTSARLAGRPTLLDVLVFDTPRGKTVDSSWIDPKTLRPLRLKSDNAARSVTLDFGAGRVRGQTTPADSVPVITDRRLGVSPFEWNVMALAIAALPLRPGYCAMLPVYSDRSGRVSWYQVQVVGDTAIERKSRGPEEVWEVVAQPDSAAPQARYWISRHHRVVSRVLVSEPGISIMYARD
jgi:hypothetical protein